MDTISSSRLQDKVCLESQETIDDPAKKIQRLERMNHLYQNCIDALPGIVLLLRSDKEILISNKAGREIGAIPGEKCYTVIQKRDTKCPWCLTSEVISTMEVQHFQYILDHRALDFYWIPIDSDLYLHQIIERPDNNKDCIKKEGTDKPESLRHMISNIAHDFNNILSAIIGYAEKAQHCLHQHKAVRNNLNLIMEYTEQGQALVKHMLVMYGHIEQELRPIILYPVINSTLLKLEAQLPAHITLRRNISVEPVQVVAEANQISIVLNNIITNAVKAMQIPNGLLDVILRSVELTADETLPYPNLKTGAYLELTIKDTGHGMDLDTLEHIFEPYFTRMNQGEGYGLGLFIVRGIVNKYGGAIKVTSQENAGTTFTIWLPVADKTDGSKETKDGSAPTGTESILYIDDNNTLVSLGKYHLERFGYNVETQTNPIEALHIFKKNPEKYDLVITDMTMPHLTGEMLARGIMQIRPEIPIIMYTGFSDLINEGRARAVGIREFLMKPIKYDKLAKIVRNILDEG